MADPGTVRGRSGVRGWPPGILRGRELREIVRGGGCSLRACPSIEHFEKENMWMDRTQLPAHSGSNKLTREQLNLLSVDSDLEENVETDYIKATYGYRNS